MNVGSQISAAPVVVLFEINVIPKGKPHVWMHCSLMYYHIQVGVKVKFNF